MTRLPKELPSLLTPDNRLAMITTMKLIAYYRVSTQKQGIDGLGMDAQRSAVLAYATQAHANVIASYTEVESGRRSDRPELTRAIAHARRAKAILCVAKLDRLARNVAFTSALMDSGTEFVACDNPHANRLTIHILAAVAEDEAKRISDRTKAALAAAKARGTRLGSARPGHWSGREDRRLAGLTLGRARASLLQSQRADEAAAGLLPLILQRREAGETLASIARELNQSGEVTPRGCQWNPMSVLRALERR